ncbi:MAG: hypothetical protein ABIJ75_03545, partial [Actinomycetota bacterium]
VPIRLADAFAAALPDLVEYLRIEDAAHLGGFDAEPELYAATVDRFIRSVAVGPSERPDATPRPGQD